MGKIHLKIWDFKIASRQIIWSKKIKMVYIALANKTSIKFEAVVLVQNASQILSL